MAASIEVTENVRQVELTLSPLGVRGATGDAGFTADETAAITGSSSPSATNVFATMADTLTQAEDQRLFGFIPGTPETTIAFNDATYVFTLAPVGTEWTYYRSGARHTITGAKTVTLTGAPPAAGTWYIWIDDDLGTLQAGQTPWGLGPTDTKVMVAYIEWDSTKTPKYLFYDERHQADISRGEHAYLHSTRGAQYASGGAISGYTLQANTTESNTFGISQGTFFDETLKNTVAALSDPNGSTLSYLIRYRTGSGGWTWKLSEVPYPYASGSYIQVDSPAGTLTDVATTGRYLNTWLLMTGAGWQVIAPQVTHASLANAAAENFTSLDLAGLTAAEFIAIQKLTWRTGSSYAPLGKCRLEAVTAINVSSIPGSSQAIIAANVSVAFTPTNYIPATPDVEAHLAAIDAVLGALLGP